MRPKTIFRLISETQDGARGESDHDHEDDARLEIRKVRERGHMPVRLERLDPSTHHDGYDVRRLPLDLTADDEAPETERILRELAHAPDAGTEPGGIIERELARLRRRDEGEPEG